MAVAALRLGLRRHYLGRVSVSIFVEVDGSQTRETVTLLFVVLVGATFGVVGVRRGAVRGTLRGAASSRI